MDFKYSDHSIRLLIVYHPRHSTENKELKVPLSVFLREFSEYLETLILAKEPIVIAGDFNIHVDVVDDSETIKLLDLLDCHDLRQHVHEPTHVDGHTLDLIMTRCADHTITTPPTSDEFISDHASVLCHLFPVVPPVSSGAPCIDENHHIQEI